jgi:uncharacterized protein
MKALILSDGIPGHFNQSRGVALLLGENILLNEEVKNLEPKIRLLRSPIQLLARYLCKDLTKFKAQIILNLFKSIDSSNIKLIIAAGGNTAAYSAALSLLTAIPNIQLGSPRGIHSNNFDVHLTIERYFDTPNNLVLDITPNLYSPKICKDASNDKASNNSALLLIGGQGIGYSYEVNEWNQLIQNIINFSSSMHSKITIVTSRRTDPFIEALLRDKLSDCYTRDSIWFHHGGANANLAELFGNAAKIFVTEDSAMMISESISSGKKVTTLFPECIDTPDRYSKHIQKYRDSNLIDSQSIKDRLSLEEGKDNIEKINLIRSDLKRSIFARIQL